MTEGVIFYDVDLERRKSFLRNGTNKLDGLGFYFLQQFKKLILCRTFHCHDFCVRNQL